MNNNPNLNKREEIIYPDRYNFLDKKNKPQISPESGKRKRHIVELIVIIATFLLTLVVMIMVFFSGLNSTADKSRDVVIRANLERMASEAYDYAERQNGLLHGFIPQVDAEVARLSGKPIVNVSSDGQRAAIFIKSAEKKAVYFCADTVSVNKPDNRKKAVIFEVSEEYAEAGNFSCLLR